MRPSPLRHTLAVLRTTIGLTQKELASLLDCSVPTIQAVELGKLSLSDRLADRVRRETGINLHWLMEDDVTMPPVDEGGNEYRRAEFERIQSNSVMGDEHTAVAVANLAFATTVSRIASLYVRGARRRQFSLCSYKLASALKELEGEFGKPARDETLGALVGTKITSNKPVDLKSIAGRFHRDMRAAASDNQSRTGRKPR